MLETNHLSSAPLMTESEIQTKIMYYLPRLLQQGADYTKRRDTFITGKTLQTGEGGDVQTHINFFYRMIKTHASYVVKDMPNINVPAERPDNIDSKRIAAAKERVLYNWRTGNEFVQKLKVSAIRAGAFGDMYFYLSYDKDKKWLYINALDPSNVIYDTVDSDPESEMAFIITARLESVEELKRKYPEHASRVCPSTIATELINVQKFYKSGLYAFDKAIVFTFIDNTHIYKIVNATVLIETKEHGYGCIPFFHWKYINIGDRVGRSLVDILYEPIKHMHMSLSFILTNGYDFATAPLMSDTVTPSVTDQKGRIRGLVTIPKGSRVEYMVPPQSNMDLYKTLEFAKNFIHFISGISEEAMAGFTGALTSAGVSIELRMDSTVREALDSQIVLQNLLQKMNAKGFELMKKFMPKENLFKSPIFGEQQSDVKFTGDMLGNNFANIVDFGGILPRSESQIVQNVMTKYKMGLISHDTALEELRYADPTLEKLKIIKEKADDYAMAAAIKNGQVDELSGFKGPKDENYYMLVENKPVKVYPEQNHQEHYLIHKTAFDKTQNQTILVHMQSHVALMGSGAGVGLPSEESQEARRNPNQLSSNVTPVNQEVPQETPETI